MSLPLMSNDQLRLPVHAVECVIWAQPAADGNPSRTIGLVPLGPWCVVVAKPRLTPEWEWHHGLLTEQATGWAPGESLGGAAASMRPRVTGAGGRCCAGAGQRIPPARSPTAIKRRAWHQAGRHTRY